MMKNIKAIAFDIDGTLYSDSFLNILIIPYFFLHLPFFLCYSRVRYILHRTAPLPDFFEYQARLMAEMMNVKPEVAKSKIDKIIYQGLKPFFKIVKPYPHVKATFSSFSKAGYKLGLLSDFPPEQKGDVWGLAPQCDVVMGSESIGALKPSKYTFVLFAREFNLKPEEVLYVGNSKRSDVEGAKNAGMKTAYKMPLWRALFRKPLKAADISFYSYRTLEKIMLH